MENLQGLTRRGSHTIIFKNYLKNQNILESVFTDFKSISFCKNFVHLLGAHNIRTFMLN